MSLASPRRSRASKTGPHAPKSPGLTFAENRAAYDRYGRLKRDYGVSVVWYLAQFQLQDGRCAICRQTQPGTALSVDHNHATGAVRELLCGACNLLIGNARESADTLRAACKYLERH